MSTKRKTFADRDSALDEAPVVESPAMVIPPTLGPGDDDGKDRGTPAAIGKALGPGDDDPTPIDRGQPATVRGPLGPGEADPTDRVNRNVRMLAQPAPGPGDTHVVRRITVFPNEKE